MVNLCTFKQRKTFSRSPLSIKNSPEQFPTHLGTGNSRISRYRPDPRESCPGAPLVKNKRYK